MKIYDIFKNYNDKISNEEFIFNSKRLSFQKNGVKIKMNNHKKRLISIFIDTMQIDWRFSAQTQKIRRCLKNGY